MDKPLASPRGSFTVVQQRDDDWSTTIHFQRIHTRIVSSATPWVIIGVGQYCTDHGLDKMNVLTEYYRDDRLWIVELKKI